MLTLVTAQAVKNVVQSRLSTKRVHIKRPNDVLVEGRKICGILVESSSSGANLDYAVIGIGLNVNSEMSKRVAQSTSIFEEKGRKVSKERVFKEILAEFKQIYLSS